VAHCLTLKFGSMVQVFSWFYSRSSLFPSAISLIAMLASSGQPLWAQVEDKKQLDDSQINHPIAPPVTRDILFQPAVYLDTVVAQTSGGIDAILDGEGGWSIVGDLADEIGSVHFAPTKEKWDFSDYSLFSIPLTNEGPGIVWIETRLDNANAQDWANSSFSQTYLQPGESGRVTVGYPRGWEKDDSPKPFEPASSKPNGWRSHWKSFNPSDVRLCRIKIRSSHAEIKLTGVRPYLAWPFGNKHNQSLLALPHIDRYGQAIPFDWPTKIKNDSDLVAQKNEEELVLSADHGPAQFNQFGGYETGPQLDATGYFRTEKIDGKWWLVDPAGKLFWSHGPCTVGNRSINFIEGNRRQLFEYLPEEGTPEHLVGMVNRKDGVYFDFLKLNSQRKYGDDWQAKIQDVTHRRLRAWGMNTLGAWSDQELMDDRRTPYTEILHIWSGPQAVEDTADPFEPGFQGRYREAIQRLADKRGTDPWMIGVFINNEIKWHSNMVERVLSAGVKQPAYSKFAETLKRQYSSLEELNRAWDTESKSWNELKPGKSTAWQADRDSLYALLANRYYSVCKQLMDELLPNHLYLGSRVHTAPAIVIREMGKHMDVYSTNHYAPLASTVPLPQDIDVPIMISEFHFGTIDRGVTGMSLCPVDGQLARERSFAAYLTAGLIDPRVVGAHWFAYSDQPATGKPNENYQIGLIDTTDTPYQGFTKMSRTFGERMYQIRMDKNARLLEVVGDLIEQAQ